MEVRNYIVDLLNSEENYYTDMSDRIWGYAEPGFREYKSSKLLAQSLIENGFSVQMGVSGMPTAFVAQWGRGKPIIGFYGEYDATPGESQKAVSYKEAIDKQAAGFGDLHNGIGVGSAAAAIAAKKAMEKYGIKGTLKYLGTPAEKFCAKCYLVKDGHADDMDCMVGWHPWWTNTVSYDVGPGCYEAVVFNFHGESCYGGRPWVGVSALDAAVLMNLGVQFLREHFNPADHITVNELFGFGGSSTTSLPDFVQTWYVVRAKSMNALKYVHSKLEDCARAASLVIGANFETRLVSRVRNWLPNHTMANIAFDNLSYVGPPKFTDEEKAYVRAIQKNAGFKPLDEPLDESLLDPRTTGAEQFSGGADDVSEFTWHTPTCWIHTTYVYKVEREGFGFEIPMWSTAALAKSGVAHKCLLTAAKAMSCTAIDLLRDENKIKLARQEFEDRIKQNPEPLAINKDAVPPIDLTIPPFYPEGWKIPTG